MSQDQPFIQKSNLGGPIIWVGSVSEDLQGGSNSVSQVDGVSNMAPAYKLHGSAEGGLRKGTMASAHPDARHFSLSQYVAGILQAAI